MTAPVMRDERTESVENASYRLAYLFMSFGLLVIIAYRGFFAHEESWDLLGLVILGGAVATMYQGRHRVLSRRWALLNVAAVAIAALIGVGLLVFRR